MRLVAIKWRVLPWSWSRHANPTAPVAWFHVCEAVDISSSHSPPAREWHEHMRWTIWVDRCYSTHPHTHTHTHRPLFTPTHETSLRCGSFIKAIVGRMGWTKQRKNNGGKSTPYPNVGVGIRYKNGPNCWFFCRFQLLKQSSSHWPHNLNRLLALLIVVNYLIFFFT